MFSRASQVTPESIPDNKHGMMTKLISASGMLQIFKHSESESSEMLRFSIIAPVLAITCMWRTIMYTAADYDDN